MKISKKKYTLYTLLLAVTCVVFLYFFILFKFEAYDDNRVYNLRLVPIEYRASLMDLFINKKSSVIDGDGILILGDSQPNGHMHPTDKTFAFILEEKLNITVVNLAFQDARILDNIYTLNYLKSNGKRFKYVIFNVTQPHVKQVDFQRLEVGDNKRSYLSGLLKEPESFLKLALKPNPKKNPPVDINLIKYTDYFKMDKAMLYDYGNYLNELILVAKDVAENVVIYVTPYSLNAVEFNGIDNLQVLDDFSHFIKSSCSINKVRCFFPEISDDEYYFDIIHFNYNGHIEFAEQLSVFLNEH